MKFYLSLIFLIVIVTLNAQDVHWSQNNENSLYQNPANSGNFDGDYKVTLSTKDQWRNVTKPYQTQAISFEVKPIYFPKFSYGILALHDLTGDGVFRTFELKIIPSFTVFNANKMKIRIGVETDWKYNQMQFSKYMFDNQYDGFMYSALLNSNEKYQTQQKSAFSFGAGINFQKVIGKYTMTSGIAFYNLNQPDQGFYGIKIPRFRRTHFFYTFNLPVNKKITITPSINFQNQQTYNELIVGSRCFYLLNEKMAVKQLIGGIYLRNKDAVILQLGCQYNKLLATISYDVNYSSLTSASGGRGGLEINCQYKWSKIQPKNLMHKKCLDYL